jgi:hypothetical protein
MRDERGTLSSQGSGSKGFERIADAIMYRWTVERDTWLAPREIEEARAYLDRVGITTRVLPDGQYEIAGGEVATVCEATQLVLIGLRRVLAARRARV